MPPSTVPYIGSKISLISNSEIRYEGILYTINTQESTIALQSVRCFGTEGRKMPEIPPSSEVYDFIIFRGQDIKDLTVLEACNAVNDPAIVSINQRPAGAKGQVKGNLVGAPSSSGASKGQSKAGAPAGRSHGGGSAAISNIFSSWGGSAQASQGSSWAGAGPAQASQGRAGPRKGERDRDDYGGGWGGKPDRRAAADYNAWGAQSWGGQAASRAADYNAWGGGGWGGGNDYGWSASSYGKGGGGQKGWGAEISKGKAGKSDYSKGGKGKGSGKDSGKAKGKDSGKGKDGRKGKDGGNGKGNAGGKGKDGGKSKGKDSGKGKGNDSGKGGSRRGGKSDKAESGVPVGELIPEDNAEAKKEFAEDFDYGAAQDKFDKVKASEDGVEKTLKPLNGYDKTNSFFDSISCEATERSTDKERHKVDREKARELDKETFGDTRRPPRPAGGRPGGKGRRRGGGKGSYW